MSDAKTFYKLKYPTLPDTAQIEELKKNELGSFVLFELGCAVIGETSTENTESLLKRIERNTFDEMGEFFNDLSLPQPVNMETFKKATLNEFIDLMVLADEMQNG